MKKVQKKNAGAGEGGSAKPNAIVLAGLQLFTQYGYRKTSIDDIAQAAQVAKRTVYLHFENKAAVLLAILEYLGDQVRQRCAAAERAGGTAVDRLTALLDAYFGIVFELFSKSEHMPELEETFVTCPFCAASLANASGGYMHSIVSRRWMFALGIACIIINTPRLPTFLFQG